MNVFELSQEIDQFFRQRGKKLFHQQGKNVQGDRLNKQLLQHFDETSLRALALDCGMMPQDIEGESYGGIALKLHSFVLYSGQWDLFRARLETERPSVPWVDTISKSSPFLPLRPEEINEYPKELQLALLLTHHFSRWELGDLANQLDQTIDWQNPPYTCNNIQFTAVMVYYLAGHQRVLQLLPIIKEMRPYVVAIQQYTYIEIVKQLRLEVANYAFVPKSPRELFLEVKAMPVTQTSPASLTLLVEMLGQHFTQLDMEEICLDAGIEYDWFGGKTTDEKVNAIAKFLERTSLGPSGKAFIAACMHHAPTVEWAGAVGLDEESIPSIESVATKGFYLFRIRTLIQQCLPDNTSIFEFVQSHSLHLRETMSSEWPPRKHRLDMVGALKRRGRLPDLLTILETEYPQQYGLFAPYTKSE